MVNEKTDIDVFVGTRIGSFKHVKYFLDKSKNSKKNVENLQDVKTLAKDDTITSMCWGNSAQSEILLGRKNQQIQVYNTTEGSFVKTVVADFGKGDIVGLGKYKRRLIAALSSGVVKIWSKKKEQEVILETGGELDRLRCCSEDDTVFATGGQENDLKVWRIGEITPMFTAKNLAHDYLELRQPVWVSDLCFMPGSDGQLLATCSRYGYVRLYDRRSQRRPVCNVEFKSMAATCMTAGFGDGTVVVGFGRGHLQQVDLRGRGRPDKGYKGSVGAVTSVAVAPHHLLVSASLDRHLKVHDANTKELLHKQYLTSKLACVLVQTESSTPLRKVEAEVKSEDEVGVKDEDDMDELFNNMDTIELVGNTQDYSLDAALYRVASNSPINTAEVEKSREKPRKKIPKEESEVKAKKSKLQATDDSIVVEEQGDPEDAIARLLKSTEKTKKKLERKKKEKRAKSLYYQA